MANLEKDGKIIITDINADRDRQQNLVKYQRLLATSFGNYATIKMSLNFFTLKEMVSDMDSERKPEIETYLATIEKALDDTVLSENKVSEEIIQSIVDIRESVKKKMQIFTAFTDSLQIFEYILKRKEPALKDELEEYVDAEALADKMFSFVFSERDKVLINTRIQEFIAELPVRMTKQRFYDIMSTSLNIYKGGEKSAVKAFAETLTDAALISKPEGFETSFPDLYSLYKELETTDYKDLSLLAYEELMDKIAKATEDINASVTDYLMLQDVINDTLVILYTGNLLEKKYLGESYETSVSILKQIIAAEDIYKAAEEFDELFVKLEGAQESAYSDLSFLDGNLDSIYKDYKIPYEDDREISENFKLLLKCDKLSSNSLFMDLDEDFTVISEVTDDAYLAELKNELFKQFDEKFANVSKFEKRAVMSKVLSMMPVFFNSQEEIRSYFSYALSACGDDSELTACSREIEDIILEGGADKAFDF